MNDVLDWLARGSAIVGLPAVLMYLIKERRKNNADARRAETDADYAEAELPNRIRSSSAVSLEAELAALQRAFDVERNSTARTVEHLSEQLEAERAQSAAKDQRIRELEEKVLLLQGRVEDLTDELKSVAADLASLHGDDQGRK